MHCASLQTSKRSTKGGKELALFAKKAIKFVAKNVKEEGGVFVGKKEKTEDFVGEVDTEQRGKRELK